MLAHIWENGEFTDEANGIMFLTSFVVGFVGYIISFIALG